MARTWKPSTRASELIGVLFDAFEDGDKWVRIQSKTTARYTGVSLVWNGIAENDESPEFMFNGYSVRLRLSESWLNANGLTRENEGWKVYAAECAELRALDAADGLAVAA